MNSILFFKMNSILLIVVSMFGVAARHSEYDHFLEKIYQRLIKNAYIKINERNNWLSQNHSEGRQFRTLQAPDLYYMFVPVFPCVYDLVKTQSCIEAHDGGKWICGLSALASSYQHTKNSSCIIYSVGSKGNFMFENYVLKTAPMCDMYVFDPTWRPKMPKGTPKGGIFKGDKSIQNPYTYFIHDYGLSGSDSNTGKFSVKSLDTIMKSFKHTHIDILKMDIEGYEFPVIEQTNWKELKIGQLLIEFHPRNHTAMQFLSWFTTLESAGYVMTGIEPVSYLFNFAQVEATFINVNWRPSGEWWMRPNMIVNL